MFNGYAADEFLVATTADYRAVPWHPDRSDVPG